MTGIASAQGDQPLPLIVEKDGPLLHIVFNRPEKRNALTAEMFELLAKALSVAEIDQDIHVAILRANGRDFCAGFDLSRLRSDEFHEDRFKREEADLYNRGLALRNLSKPTIAAVQGNCIAGGLLFSQMCDLIVASDDALFYNPLVRMGGVALEILMEPWDLGIRQAKRYLFTGDKIPAEVALKLGMVTDIAPRESLEAATVEIAKKIAAMPPTTMKLLKKSINHTQDTMGMRAALDYHFALHEFGHTTQESAKLLHEAREKRSLKEYFAKRDTGDLKK